MVSSSLPDEGLVSVCGTVDGRLYRIDCTSQGGATNASLAVTPLQSAEVHLLTTCCLTLLLSCCLMPYLCA